MTISVLMEKGKTMDIRQKLVELLDKAYVTCLRTDCFKGCKFYSEKDDNCVDKLTADILIANGVTVQECARPLEEWGEDYGDVLWWKFPIEEPPYVGSPLDADWPGYHTHWTPITLPQLPQED